MKSRPLFITLLALWAGLSHAAPPLVLVDPVPAPPISLADRQSRPVSLKAMQGKVVLVNFWATYCKPCREEMPSLDRLRQRLAPRGFEVLGVDVAENAPSVDRFLQTTPVGFPILFDPDASTMTHWKAIGLPTSFLVDRRGRLRGKLVGGTDWENPALLAQIEKLLAE